MSPQGLYRLEHSPPTHPSISLSLLSLNEEFVNLLASKPSLWENISESRLIWRKRNCCNVVFDDDGPLLLLLPVTPRFFFLFSFFIILFAKQKQTKPLLLLWIPFVFNLSLSFFFFLALLSRHK